MLRAAGPFSSLERFKPAPFWVEEAPATHTRHAALMCCMCVRESVCLCLCVGVAVAVAVAVAVGVGVGLGVSVCVCVCEVLLLGGYLLKLKLASELDRSPGAKPKSPRGRSNRMYRASRGYKHTFNPKPTP